MLTRIVVTVVAALCVSSIALGQSTYTRPKSSPTPTPTPVRSNLTVAPPRTRMNPTPTPIQSKRLATQPRPTPTPAPISVQVKPTPTPVPAPDIKAYLDRQLANSKDQKFHLTAKGKDLPLTPFHFWAQKSSGANSTTTCVDMRSEDGTVYDIDFVTTATQVSSIRVHRINGAAVR
ncbi:MAG: hypothetical protein ABI925_12840 [Verrucomicrobiota bacterium]